MAKKSGTSSWLTAVKRAFRSPTKDSSAERKSCRRRDENNQHHQQEDEDQKKREKRRWHFRKPAHFHANDNQQSDQPKSGVKVNDDIIETKDVITSSPALAEQRHAIAVAAAAATAQAAAEIVRLAKPRSFCREQCYAAIVIQTAFRGYLARRALRALKGLVKLQALVRGQNVRKQAKLTLKCMQALVRVQDQVSHQRARLSLESRRKSMLAEIISTNSFWDSTCLHDARDRVSISREMTSGDVGVGDWDDCPQTSEEIEAKLQVRKEAALKREKALAYAFSQQIRRARRNPSAGNEEEIEEKHKWLDRWMATKQWESDYTTNIAERRDQNIRTVEIDTSRPHSSHSTTPNARRPYQTPKAQPKGPYSGPTIPSSPAHKAQYNAYSCMTPSPSKTKLLKVRSASPRCPKEDRCHSAAHTPSLGSYCAAARYGMRSSGPPVPNYMAATESTRARARPNSTPRQRPSTPERDQSVRGQGGFGGVSGGSAKKRLSYCAALEPHNSGSGVGFGQHLRSPSFKSLQNGCSYGIESLSSCNDESIFGRDVSPCSTTDLRWLK